MYAVIRAGGKQYRVAPGDTIRVEKLAVGNSESSGERVVEFASVLAASCDGRLLTNPANARVVGTILGDGRGDKVLVFHFKRKKQYKKLRGHRQAYTSVRIDSIEVEGRSYTAAPGEKTATPSQSASRELGQTA